MPLPDNKPSVLDPAVLGQMMAAENLVSIFPTNQKIGEFTAGVIEKIPGVFTCRLCIGGVLSPDGQSPAPICRSCQIKVKCPDTQPKSKCPLHDESGIWSLSLETASCFFGFIFINVADQDLFDAYQPFIINFCNHVAIHLENRNQRERLRSKNEELKKNRDDLENLVRLRTKELAESEEKFSTAFQNAPLLMTITALEDGHILDVNNAFIESTGYSRKEAIGATSIEIGWISKETRHRMVEILKTHGQVKNIEVTANCKNGSQLFCLYSGEIIEFGGKKRLLSTATDVTEKNRAQEALQKSEDLLSGMAKQIPGVLYQFYARKDGTKGFYYISERSESIVGLKPNPDGFFERFTEMVIPEHRQEFIESVDKSILEISPWHYEGILQKNTGQRIWFSGQSSPTVLENEIVFNGIVQDISERKQAEKVLSQKTKDLKTSQRIAHLGSWRLDLATNQVEWTEELYHMYGFDPMLPPPPYTEHMKLFTPESWERLSTSLDRTAKTGIPYELELETVRDGEKNGWMWVRGEAVNDDAGNIVGLWGAAQDITERKLTEKILAESESCYRELFNNIKSGVAIYTVVDGGKDFIFKDFNRAGERMDGDQREELVGKSIFETRPGVEEFGILDIFRRVWETGIPQSFPATVYKDDRLSRWYENFVYKLPSGEIVAVFDDVTERKRAELKLQESEEKFRNFTEQSFVGFYIIQDNRFKYVNPQFAETFGYTVEECLNGMSFSQLVHTKDQSTAQEQVRRRVAGEIDTVQYSIRGVKKSGDIIHISIYGSSLIYQGRPAAIGTILNITKELEMEKRIAQSQRMEAIGSLAGGIAHDFNNILFPIVGLAEMLIEDLPPSSPQQVNAQEILHAGKRGADLVKQILSFSRQQEHKMIPTRVQKVIKEVIRLTRSTIPKNIGMRQNLAPGCGLVLADSVQLHQIGMNLITNAYHAVEEKGGDISIEVKEMVLEDENTADMSIGPGNYVVLSVSDTGVGIPRTNLSKIFDPYFTTKQQGKGTGLGLAVVYGIVKEHKADITVCSEVGKGTAIKVYFPLMVTHDICEPDIEQIPDKGGTEHILLVDDESAVARLEKQMLERLGYTVTTRISSVDALEAFKNTTDVYDLVITDMSMPNMTGEQLARELLAVRPDLPVIICTGFSERINEDLAKMMGFKGFLQKPIVKSALAAEVRRVLDN